MRTGRKLLVMAAFAAVAAFVVGGTASVATGDVIHPTCTWTVDKTASLHSDPSRSITALTLALGQTVQVDYKIVVTRTCDAGFDPFAEGGSAHVVDSYAGELATHLFVDDLHLVATRTFNYSRNITASTCDAFDVDNTVDVLDGDPTNPFATDSLTIHVTVNCDHGCTLTQGYWKTHSRDGPAPYDNNWANLGSLQEDTPFYYSGQTWYQVFWTPPAGGNVYYQLAHQYMAAVLNKLNGASSTAAVNAAIAAATAYFNNPANTPTSAANLSKAAKATLGGYASTLGSYNEGAIGPGHCDE